MKKNVHSHARVTASLLAAWAALGQPLLGEGPQRDRFEAAGRVELVFAGETNRHDFVVTVRDGRHRIQTQDHASSPTRRVVGFDGTDFYQVDTLLDEAGKPVEFGHVYTGCAATNLFGVGDVLRLSFLMDSSASNRLGALTNMALFNANRMLFPFYRCRVVEEGPPGACFLGRVVFSGEGDERRGSGDIGAFEVLSATNIGGFALPLRATLFSQAPPVGVAHGSSILESMTLTVSSIGVPSHDDMVPTPSGRHVQVWDTRFEAETGQPLLYAITNQAWKSREDPWIRARVHELRMRRLVAEGQLKARRLPVLLGFGILLTLPLAIYLYLRTAGARGGS